MIAVRTKNTRKVKDEAITDTNLRTNSIRYLLSSKNELNQKPRKAIISLIEDKAEMVAKAFSMN